MARRSLSSHVRAPFSFTAELDDGTVETVRGVVKAKKPTGADRAKIRKARFAVLAYDLPEGIETEDAARSVKMGDVVRHFARIDAESFAADLRTLVQLLADHITEVIEVDPETGAKLDDLDFDGRKWAQLTDEQRRAEVDRHPYQLLYPVADALAGGASAKARGKSGAPSATASGPATSSGSPSSSTSPTEGCSGPTTSPATTST